MEMTLAELDMCKRCAKRELDKRKFFYPKWIASGKMTQEKADFEIAGMQKIYDDYCWRVIHAQPEQQKLF